MVTIANTSGNPIDLTGWKLRDRADSEFALTGTVPASGHLAITMALASMPLNNSGDDIELIRPDGTVEDAVTYTSAEVSVGGTIGFGAMN